VQTGSIQPPPKSLEKRANDTSPHPDSFPPLDLPVELLPALVHVLFISYPRYNDRSSRLTVLEVLKELNAWNSVEFLKAMVPAVQKEAEKLAAKSPDG